MREYSYDNIIFLLKSPCGHFYGKCVVLNLQEFGNMVLRKIFWFKGKQVAWELGN